MRASAVLVFIAACTSPPTGPVSVIAREYLDASPQAGVVVLAHRPDGSVAARTTTAADGTATIDVEDGGAVTLFGGAFATIADVGRGDTLVFGLVEPGAVSRMTVLLPPFAAPAQFAVSGPGFTSDDVGFESPRVVTPMYGQPARGDVLGEVVGTDGPQYLIAHDQPLVGGSTLDLSGLAWTTPPRLSCTVTGLPADTDDAFVTRLATQGGVELDEGFGAKATNGAPFDCGPAGLGDGAITDVTISRPRGLGVADDVEVVTVTGPSTGVDVSSAILPRWTGAVGFDGRTLTWSTDGSGTAAPVAVRLEAAVGTTGWTIVVPGGWSSFALPDLPDDLAPGGAGTGASGTLIGSQTGDYASYRGRAFAVQRYGGYPGDGDPAAPFERLDAPRPPPASE